MVQAAERQVAEEELLAFFFGGGRAIWEPQAAQPNFPHGESGEW